jgi:predicted MFS family arabinose efflux permease
MAVFTLVMMAGFALGAVLWGALAREAGVAGALWAAAAVSALGLALTARLPVEAP